MPSNKGTTSSHPLCPFSVAAHRLCSFLFSWPLEPIPLHLASFSTTVSPPAPTQPRAVARPAVFPNAHLWVHLLGLPSLREDPSIRTQRHFVVLAAQLLVALVPQSMHRGHKTTCQGLAFPSSSRSGKSRCTSNYLPIQGHLLPLRATAVAAAEGQGLLLQAPVPPGWSLFPPVAPLALAACAGTREPQRAARAVRMGIRSAAAQEINPHLSARILSSLTCQIHRETVTKCLCANDAEF